MADERNFRVNLPNSPACGQWETLLADALDGALKPEDEDVFTNHMANCAACAAMFEEARRGQQWLEFLAPEPEIPEGLLERILAETAHGHRNQAGLIMAGGSGNVVAIPPVWQRPGFMASIRRFAEPRLMMTAAMAFFSIALTISVSGIKISSVPMADLRPTAVRSYLEKRIMTASTPVVRYYDHLRFVYEMESRMRELRRSTLDQPNNQDQPSNQTQPNPQGESHHKDGGSELKQQNTLPSQMPERTANPSPWNGEMEQTRLDGVPHTWIQQNAFGASGFSRTNGLAMPEGSTRCDA
jgi:hypothetical protein